MTGETTMPLQRRQLFEVLAHSRAAAGAGAPSQVKAEVKKPLWVDDQAREGCRAQGRVTLTQWSLELIAQRGRRKIPVVRGVRYDQKGPSNCMWRTCEIVDVVTPKLLLTRKSAVVELVGPLSRSLALKVHLPARLARNFASGFPVQGWMDLLSSAAPGARRRTLSQVEPPEVPDHARRTLVPLPAAVQGTAGHLPKRPRAALAAWTAEDSARLRQALAEVRPSAPHYWRQVALCVGKAPEECRAQAFGFASSPVGKRGKADALKCIEAHEDQPGSRHASATLAGNGSRRPALSLLNATCFGSGRDFLQLPMARKSTEAVVPFQLSCARTPRQRCPAAPWRDMSCMDVADADLSGSSPCTSSFLDLGDCTWRPKGIESFICETRTRRGKLVDEGGEARGKSSSRPLRGAHLARKTDFRYDPALLRRVGRSAEARYAAPDSEEEAAPVAAIPRAPIGLDSTPSMDSESDGCEA